MFSSSARSRGPTAAWRMSVWTTVAFAAGSAVAFLIVYQVVLKAVNERSDAWVRGEAGTLAQVLEASPRDAPSEALMEEIAEMASEEVPLAPGAAKGSERPVFFLVTARDGEPEVWVGPRDRQPILQAVRRATWRDDAPQSLDVPGWEHPFRAVMHGSDDGRRLYLGLVDLEARALLSQVRLTSIVLWLCMIAFGFAISCLSAWRILKRVDDITDTAAAIGGHGLGRRVPAGEVRDEISRLARTFNDMLGRIDDSVNRIRSVTDEIAHDLRSPLTAIRGNLELILIAEKQEDVRGVLASIIDEVDRLLRILNTTLDVAEAEAGALRLRRRPTDMGQLAARMADVYRPAAEEQGLSLAVTGGGELTATVDPDLVGRALANLLDNALQHAAPGGGIAIAARRDGGSVLLEVTDSGPGFPPEVRERAFERFVRGRESRGSGLGLALVNAAALAHGGEVQILDPPAGGATVRLRLPRDAGPAEGE